MQTKNHGNFTSDGTITWYLLDQSHSVDNTKLISVAQVVHCTTNLNRSLVFAASSVDTTTGARRHRYTLPWKSAQIQLYIAPSDWKLGWHRKNKNLLDCQSFATWIRITQAGNSCAQYRLPLPTWPKFACCMELEDDCSEPPLQMWLGLTGCLYVQMILCIGVRWSSRRIVSKS